MKKIICALLALMAVLSLVPLSVSAAETATVTVTVYYAKDLTGTYQVAVGSEPVTLEDSKYVQASNKRYYVLKKYSNESSSLTIPAYDGTAQWHENWDNVSVYYDRHSHNYRYRYDRKTHWQICACGDTTKPEQHVDPIYLEEKKCDCGYKFSSNCDLTVLWLRNMQLSERFNREQTEYIGKVNHYSNRTVTETSISARSFDALAHIQLPTDLSLKEGPTKFEVVVTAEDRTTTKTYTVIAVTPVEVDGHLLLSDGTQVTAELTTKTTKRVAAVTAAETVLEEMQTLAIRDGAAQLTLAPQFSFWRNDQVDVTLPCAALQDAELDLVVQTEFAALTIPRADLQKLVEEYETLTVSILKDGTLQILADGEALTELPDTMVLELPDTMVLELPEKD